MLLIALLCAVHGVPARLLSESPSSSVASATQSANAPYTRWMPPGRSLQDARLGKRMKEKILRDVGATPDLEREVLAAEKYTTVLPFTVGDASHPRRLIRVWGGLCGSGVCPMLIYDAASGQKLLQEDGWDFQFLPTMHAGARDVMVRHKDGCCNGSTVFYRYDGSRYRLSRTTSDHR
ncbi:hypothetical protein [Granulicella rosea]|uniref:hypothetical protein n=1 Tax=Granulicella rosea TaxID=474952 RepID=UPI00115D6F03|nr:hypothetical protein [Granulicella rosea]